MLSVAVKNAILVILIVLILHFLLKNYLLERRTGPNDKPAPMESFESSPAYVPVTTQKPVASQSLPTPVNETDTKVTDSASELFKFVFDDSSILQSYESSECKPSSLSSVPEPSSVKPSKQPEKQTINFDNLVLNEYDNESVLNGGNIFNSLKGFDSLAGDYMAYEPIGCAV